MLVCEVNSRGLEPSFNGTKSSLEPKPTELSYREVFYHLVNVEEHPEVLPLAYDVASETLAAAREVSGPSDAMTSSEDAKERLSRELQKLEGLRRDFARPWQQPTDDLTRRQVLHYYMKYLPIALVDGCWLQGGLRVAAAHTVVGASLTGLYQHQVRAFVDDPGRHFVADYRAVYGRLGSELEAVSSHSFAKRKDLPQWTFELPIFFMAISQFTRSFPAEILGINLVWQYLDLSTFGPDLIRDTCAQYGLPSLGEDLNDPEHLEKGRQMARESTEAFLAQLDGEELQAAWDGIRCGITAGLDAWTQWMERAREEAPSGPPDPRQEMIDMLWRKAPDAAGYHANRSLGSSKIDDLFDLDSFDGPAFLDKLAESPFVKAGKSDRSALLGRLIGFGGPMLAVFSPVEQKIIQSWIDSLPTGDEAEGENTAQAAPLSPTLEEELTVSGRGWSPSDFRQRSNQLYSKLTVRELYYHLINVEFYPDILPMAERFAHDRLERSMAMLWKGERPIPSTRYSPEALERWVTKKHRDQVDSYRPPEERPDVNKDAFIEATVQLAPLILIDGGWLQGMASPALIHTPVARMLFHVLVEELGEGKVEEHHANVYRDLLAAMGEEAPLVDTWEFAHWDRLDDASFEVPALWLTISCFPRHFLPEILGLNLAVELAGVGGPYMEARDTLRRFRYPTLFVDMHNAADNVSVGHAAWAMNAIKRYMDEVANRDGPHNVDRVWHRVWAGVRATLPQIGRFRLRAHRIRRRLFGDDPSLVPLIFPS